MNTWKFFISNIAFFVTWTVSAPAAFGVTTQGHRMMITAPSSYGVEIGERVAKMGGNVVDVAVAVGVTLAVTTPYYASLGGGGFALVKMGKEPVAALDFRETAPGKTHPNYFIEDSKRSSQDGGSAVATPGNPMGLYELHKKYGKLPWKTLMEGAIRLADRGFELSGEWVEKTASQKGRFNPAGKQVFFRKDGKSHLPGALFMQPNLGKALKRLRDSGPSGFYSGPVAQDLVQSVKAAGGDLTLEDLKKYKVRWLNPIKTSYEGNDIYLMPPPSSGGIVIAQALELVKRTDLSKQALLSVNELHLLGEIQSRAFRGRSLLGDPDFLKNPLDQLLSENSLKNLTNSIQLNKTSQLKPLDESKDVESNETTHFTVMDIAGNAVSLTYTLNGNYGSGVVSDQFGIALNNEMDDFTTQPGKANQFGLIQGSANRVEPFKRPLSSMSPTLVLHNNKTILALGAPGGPRIISGVFQVLYRVLSQKMDLDLAIQTPRVHHQYLPNTLYVDQQRFSPEILRALEKKGHKIEESWMAKVYGIQLTESGILKAAYDSRGEGAAGGF